MTERVEVSHSRVQTYERCPWMYHLVYDLGWRAGPKAPAAFGHSLHRALDAFLAKDNADRSLERLLEFYDQHWVNEGFKSAEETMDAYERGKKILENFHKIELTRSAEVVATEKEFEVELVPGVFFKGTIDRIDRYPDGTEEIIEYKTHAKPWTPERIAGDRQMTFYSLGLGASLKLRYFFLSSGESVETTRSDQQRKEARALLLKTGEHIRRQEFPPNHASCPTCEFGKRCAHFKK